MTHVALIVKEDGKIYVNEVPEEPLPKASIYADELAMRNYERQLASAKETAVLCADQEQAQQIIIDDRLKRGDVPPFKYRGSLVIGLGEGIYPIPDLQWERKGICCSPMPPNINHHGYCDECPGYSELAILTLSEQPKTKPQLICYCGSLRVAKEAFKQVEYLSVIEGNIALLPCCMYVDIQREYGADSDYKQKADELHKRKIDICDEVFVLNVDGYIGDSTRSEIEYALSIGKPVKYLENNLKENQ